MYRGTTDEDAGRSRHGFLVAIASLAAMDGWYQPSWAGPEINCPHRRGSRDSSRTSGFHARRSQAGRRHLSARR